MVVENVLKMLKEIKHLVHIIYNLKMVWIYCLC